MKWYGHWLCVGIILVRGIFLIAPAQAQVFRLGEWQGSLEYVSDFVRQDTEADTSQRSRFQNVLNQERLALRNVGAFIYDPRLISLSFGGTFGLSQNWLGVDSENETRQGTLLGYDFFTSILPEKGLSLNFFADRSQDLVSGGLPGRTEILSENRGATLFARYLYIPSTLNFRQNLQDQESRSRGIIARRQDRRNVLAYEGFRGWEDSEMSLRYEFIDHADQIFPSSDYQSHEGNLYHSLDFGPELNRRWDSRMRFFTQTGVTELTTLNGDELLRIDHTERLQTNYRYNLLRLETAGGASTNHHGSFQLLHRLYESLTTNLGIDATFQSLPGGKRDIYHGRLDLAYTKRIPWDGRLNIGLSGRMQYDTSRFRVTDSFVPQESHVVATPFALPIPLSNAFVVEGSVVVTKIAFGPLPLGCFPPPGPPTPLVLGRDYTLRTVGDITEIEPIACTATTAGINPGDTIAVDYRFTVSPSLTFTTGTWRADVSLDYRWIRPFFIHEQTDQNLVSGRDGRFLDDQSSDTLGTELRYDDRRLRASLLGEARRFSSGRIAFDTIRSNQFLGWAIVPELTLTLQSDQSLTDFSVPEKRRTRVLGGRATLIYIIGTGLFGEVFGGLRQLTDTLLPNERIGEAGLRLRLFIRRLEVAPLFEFIDRQRGITTTKEYRATLRIVRRF